MTTKELLEIVSRRGLKIEFRNGGPVLVRPPNSDPVTDALLAVLKIHRDRVIEEISRKEVK